MSDHTYTTGDKVECISTGDVARYVSRDEEYPHRILVTIADNDGWTETIPWKLSDCRPSVDHAKRCQHADAEDGACSHPKNMTPECHTTACPINSPFARIAELEHRLDQVGSNSVDMHGDAMAELAAKDAIIADLKKLISSEASAWRAEALKWMDDRAELEAQVAKLEARNERMTQYVDDACECCRCCECQGWNPECSILATKRHKGIDIVTGEQLRAAAEGGE